MLIFCTTITWSKSYPMYFDSIMKKAAIIKYVRVLSYTDTIMIVKILPTEDTLIFSSNMKKISDYSRKRQLEIYPNSDDMQCYWPKIGEEVLIVTDSNNRINLFAIKEDSVYHFWDPINSV